MRGLSLGFFSICLAALSLQISGAPQTVDQQKFKVTGSVVNSLSGEPIGGALVEFRGTEFRTVMCGPDGHFEADNLPAGTALVLARKPGFASPNRQLQTFVNASTDPLVIKLEPLASISGTIVDREGEPIDGIAIQCWQEAIFKGRKRLQSSQGATTDETGRFEIEDVSPGRYIMSTAEKPLYQVQNQGSEPARYIYPPTYYPDASNRDGAQVLEVAPGEDLRIDMTLHSVRGMRVSFVTVPPYANVTASLSNDDGLGARLRGAHRDRSGTHTFGAVPPGNWKIVVRGPFSGGEKAQEHPLYGELPIEVGTSDIDNLKIPIEELHDIPVQLAGDVSPGMPVQLVPKDWPPRSVNANPAGVFPTVDPGSYHVVVNNANLCVTNITSGSLDLQKDDLVVTAGSSVAPVVVTVSANCPQVTITSNSSAGTTIVVTRETAGFEPRVLGMAGTELRISLSPGEYKLYAFDDITNLEYANPEALRNFRSESVALDANQQISVQLEVNQRHAR